MLRIAKSTPGVLDLSAVKDEHGIPVTLNGPSHRDVPNHEGDNPVLQRIVELRWVTVFPAPLAAPDEEPPTGSIPTIDPPPAPTVTSDVETDTKETSNTGIVETTESSTPAPPPSSETGDDVIDTAGAEQAPDAATLDTSTKLENSARPSGKSDTRKAGRRS